MGLKLLITETMACTFLLNSTTLYGLCDGLDTTQPWGRGLKLGRNGASTKEVISGLRDFCISP
jgi:hypothetical protein